MVHDTSAAYVASRHEDYYSILDHPAFQAKLEAAMTAWKQGTAGQLFSVICAPPGFGKSRFLRSLSDAIDKGFMGPNTTAVTINMAKFQGDSFQDALSNLLGDSADIMSLIPADNFVLLIDDVDIPIIGAHMDDFALEMLGFLINFIQNTVNTGRMVHCCLTGWSSLFLKHLTALLESVPVVFDRSHPVFVAYFGVDPDDLAKAIFDNARPGLAGMDTICRKFGGYPANGALLIHPAGVEQFFKASSVEEAASINLLVRHLEILENIFDYMRLDQALLLNFVHAQSGAVQVDQIRHAIQNDEGFCFSDFATCLLDIGIIVRLPDGTIHVPNCDAHMAFISLCNNILRREIIH
jgi:hypothetical protein